MSLYTGLRPNELNTVQIEGDFVADRNSKRKGGIQKNFYNRNAEAVHTRV